MPARGPATFGGVPVLDAALWAEDAAWDDAIGDDEPAGRSEPIGKEPVFVYCEADIPDDLSPNARAIIVRLLVGPATPVQYEKAGGAAARPLVATLTERILNLCEFDDMRAALVTEDGRGIITADPGNPLTVLTTAVQTHNPAFGPPPRPMDPKPRLKIARKPASADPPPVQESLFGGED